LKLMGVACTLEDEIKSNEIVLKRLGGNNYWKKFRTRRKLKKDGQSLRKLDIQIEKIEEEHHDYITYGGGGLPKDYDFQQINVGENE